MVCVATARRKRRRRKREAETNVLIEITAFVADFTYMNDNMYDHTAGAYTYSYFLHAVAWMMPLHFSVSSVVLSGNHY